MAKTSLSITPIFFSALQITSLLRHKRFFLHLHHYRNCKYGSFIRHRFRLHFICLYNVFWPLSYILLITSMPCFKSLTLFLFPHDLTSFYVDGYHSKLKLVIFSSKFLQASNVSPRCFPMCHHGFDITYFQASLPGSFICSQAPTPKKVKKNVS